MRKYIFDENGIINTETNTTLTTEDIIDVIYDLEDTNTKLQKRIKDMEINNANNNMFHGAFLSAYNHVADMDLPYDIKEEILEAFNKREI